LRGLALYASDDLDLQVLGDNFLASRVPGDSKEEQRRIDYWLSLSPPPPKAIVEQMSRIVALSGPSVIAIDQIDALLSPAVSAGVEPGGGTGGREPEDGDIERGALDVVAGGLMDLRQITSRTLCVVSCLTTSWRAIRTRAVTTAQDRFRSSAVLGTMSEAAIVRLLVERRFGHFYRTAGFTPPHPTWPIAGSAFAGAVDRTPRAVLQAIDKHVDGCLARRRVVELTDFDQVLDPEDGGHDNGADSLLDERYRQLVAQFDVGRVLDPEAEDVEIPRLLASGLHAWAIEQGDGNRFKVEALAGKRPHLHARLRQILDPETERQIQWSYRAIAQSAARAVQSRLKNAIEASGLGQPDRSLVILRADRWPSGPKTAALVADFERLGGQVVAPGNDDFACFHALRQMLIDSDPRFASWLRSRRTASSTALLAPLPTGGP
jgi:hypothetical protein